MSLQTQFPNPGVYIVENDISVYSRGSYHGVVYLVIGSSKSGPHNAPVFIETLSQFKQTFGDIDYRLERKSSYFHRTCEKLLETGPIYCLSLLPTNSENDTLEWKGYSCATNIFNDKIRSTPYEEMFDRSSFWIRSTEQILYNSKIYDVNPEKTILHVVNYGNKSLTLFIIKDKINMMDVTFEEWYEGENNVPSYLHKNDYINDYIIRFIAVGGDFTNYLNLSVDITYRDYFNNTGLIKEKVDEFLNDKTVNVIADYTVSLIPYFKNKNGDDIFIETIVNKYTSNTGLFVAFDTERFETEYPNGLVDLNGQHLVDKNTFVLNYLSYEDVLTDTIILPEQKLDLIDNSWGDPNWPYGRTNLLTEGYVHNTFMKPLILSQTTSYLVTPLSVSTDSYAILNGKKIEFTETPEYLLELNKLLVDDSHFALIVVLTENGIDFRTGLTNPNSSPLYLPPINAEKEIVLAYYEISLKPSGDILTTIFPIALTTEDDERSDSMLPGWVPAFMGPQDSWLLNKIALEGNSVVPYKLKLRFKGANIIMDGDYVQNRTYYMYKYLMQNITPGKSIILDYPSSISPIGGTKQIIENVSQTSENNDIIVTIEVKNKDANIWELSTLTMGYVSIYFSDYELILQNETIATTNALPYVMEHGGVFGQDSDLYKKYYNGEINTGDRIFREIDSVNDVTFIAENGKYKIKFTNSNVNYFTDKIYIVKTKYNDGIYTVLTKQVEDDYIVLVVMEPVVHEHLDEIIIYDATKEFYLEFSLDEKTGNLVVQYKSRELDKDYLYKHSTSTVKENYHKTLEIEKILNERTILLEYERYNNLIEIGDLIRLFVNEPKYPDELIRNLGKIVDVHKFDTEGNYLYVEADGPIYVSSLTFVTPNESTSGNVVITEQIAELYLPIDKWVLTYKGTYFKGFEINNDSLPDGTDERLQTILSLIEPGTGIFKALSNKNNIIWRYLVDSYGIGFNTNVKKPLAQLCKEHNSLGFINLPSVKQFIKYNYTSFSVNGNFDINLFISGGVKQSNDSITFQLIGDDASSYVAYFFPNIKVEDLETKRVISIPPAAWAATSFVENKWQNINNGLYHWFAVAGVKYGTVNDIADLEYSFNESDLNRLHQFHLNPITTNHKGKFWIYSNNTAYKYDNALKYITTRELLIDLEYDLYQMLLNYQWRFNNKETRRKIVNAADEICKKYKMNSGLYDYKNIMDERNNTPEIIDSGMGILDTYIEPIKAMGTIVLRIQILKTGSLRSSQFLR